MDVRITVPFIVNCKIYTHTTTNKTLLTEFSHQINLFGAGYFHRQRRVDMPCCLTVFPCFGTLYSIPQNSMLLEILRSVVWQQNFFMYNFTLSLVIVGNAVILIFDFLSRNVCGFCYCACAFSSAYDFGVKMINRYMNISFHNSVYTFLKICNRLKTGLKQALFFCSI